MLENIIIKKLQRISDELKLTGKSEDIIVNILKQELQYYILDFVYNHSKYSSFVMYGGTLLRIVYRLSRMSEDLDFQTNQQVNLEEVKNDMIKYFEDRYGFTISIIIKSRPEHATQTLFINFDVLKEFHFDNITWTILKIRLDVNFFEMSDNFIKETHPIVHEGLVFSIVTYPLSTLMASKIGAVLQRTKRGIADKMTDCKPRDIYDLLWYMEKKIVPDLEYLKAKGENYNTLYDLFYSEDIKKGLKFRVGNLKDDLFKTDLAQFFFDRSDFEIWLYNWRARFVALLDAYEVSKIKELRKIYFSVDFFPKNRAINYFFTTDTNDKEIQFSVYLNEPWFVWRDVKIENGHRKAEIEFKIESAKALTELEYEYIGLFYEKIRAFIQKNKNILLQNYFKTKIIRATADNLKPDAEVFLDKRILERIQFEELM